MRKRLSRFHKLFVPPLGGGMETNMKKILESIRIVDIICIFLAAALIFGIYLFTTPVQIAADGERIIHYTIELEQRPQGFFENITPGAVVLDGVSATNIGTVVSAYALPFREPVYDESAGIIRMAEVEGFEITRIVIEASVDISDYGLRIGSYLLRVNQNIFTRSHDFAGAARVANISYR